MLTFFDLVRTKRKLKGSEDLLKDLTAIFKVRHQAYGFKKWYLAGFLFHNFLRDMFFTWTHFILETVASEDTWICLKRKMRLLCCIMLWACKLFVIEFLNSSTHIAVLLNTQKEWKGLAAACGSHHPNGYLDSKKIVFCHTCPSLTRSTDENEKWFERDSELLRCRILPWTCFQCWL